MIEFFQMFIHPNCLPFSISLTVLLMLCLVELLTGSLLSDFIDNLLPDFNIDVD